MTTLPLPQFAQLRAHLDRGAPRDEVLSSHGLDPGTWSAAEESWLLAPSDDADRRLTRQLELARRMPGGVVALWKRDRFGRPEQREVLGGAFPGKEARSLSRVGYRWRGADELAMLVDTREGPTQYEHDARGHLIRALFADGTVQHRVSDAVSNLYATPERSDRSYGRGGRLERVGSTELRYDHEGRLAEKRLSDGAKGVYRWTESGRLAAVVRPDGAEVRFVYDALGRRVRKEYGDSITEYVWDGDDLVHERVTRAGEAQPVVTRGRHTPHVELRLPGRPKAWQTAPCRAGRSWTLRMASATIRTITPAASTLTRAGLVICSLGLHHEPFLRLLRNG